MNRGQVFGFLLLIAIASTVYAKTGYGPGEQDWDFVNIREGAHIFYWLYFTTANVHNYTDRPLVIWLQGGPGASSTAYGNFRELGPLDIYGNDRNSTWVKDMNVLFIDSPVGSGFSYVDDFIYLTYNNSEIALDLVEFMKGFYERHPEFVDVPLHIFCESYAGKMAPEFALELYYAIQRDEIKCNFTSLALGNPFTSPIDSMLAWAPFLFYMGFVDEYGYENITTAANIALEYVQDGRWYAAFEQWAIIQSIWHGESKGVYIYNVERPTNWDEDAGLRNSSFQDQMGQNLTGYALDEDLDQKLINLMRGPVSKALGIPPNVVFESQRWHAYAALKTDLMKPVVYIVNELLDKTDLKVGVYSGQLDLACPTAGTLNWIEQMQWSYRDKYVKAPRLGISVDGILEGYEKSAGNFTMFWVNRAGHMVPADNPAAMGYILKKFTNYG